MSLVQLVLQLLLCLFKLILFFIKNVVFALELLQSGGAFVGSLLHLLVLLVRGGLQLLVELLMVFFDITGSLANILLMRRFQFLDDLVVTGLQLTNCFLLLFLQPLDLLLVILQDLLLGFVIGRACFFHLFEVAVDQLLLLAHVGSLHLVRGVQVVFSALLELVCGILLLLRDPFDLLLYIRKLLDGRLLFVFKLGILSFKLLNLGLQLLLRELEIIQV